MDLEAPGLGKLSVRGAHQGQFLFRRSVEVEADRRVRSASEKGADLRVAKLRVARQSIQLFLWLAARIDDSKVLRLAESTQLLGQESLGGAKAQSVCARFGRSDRRGQNHQAEEHARARAGRFEQAVLHVQQKRRQGDSAQRGE